MDAVAGRGASRRAPGPRGLAGMRGTLDFYRDPLAYLAGLAKWGEVVRTSAGPIVFHVLFAPRWIRYVLAERPENFVKRGVLDDLAPVLGEGLLISEGERWRARRAAAQPGFARKAVAAFVPGMDAEARALVARLEAAPEEVFDASEAAMLLALSVVGRTLFEAELGGRAAALSRAVEDVSRLAYRRARAVLKLPLGLPTPANRAYRRAIAELERTVRGLLGRDGARPAGLRALAAASDPESGRPLGEDDLRDEAMSLFLAGHETTASTLAWTLDHLAREPELQARVRAEVRAALGLDGGLESAALERLPLADAVVSEVLRLHPPGWLLMRRAVQRDAIAGFDVPARSFVTLPVHALHRSPALWHEPERFAPERFLAGAPDPFAYLPFGGGPRRCLGELFARLELCVALARLLDRFALAPLGPAPEPAPLMTLRPKTAVRLRLASAPR